MTIQPTNAHFDEDTLHQLHSTIEHYGNLNAETRKKMRLLNSKWYQQVNNTITDIAIVEHAAFPIFKNFPNLQKLTIHGTSSLRNQSTDCIYLCNEINQRIFWDQERHFVLEDLKKMTELRFENAQFLTDDHLVPFGHLTQLQSLGFINCSNLVGRGLNHLISLKQLKALDLTGQSPEKLAKEGGLDAVRKLPALSSLLFGPLTAKQATCLVKNGLTNLRELHIDSGVRRVVQRSFAQIGSQFLDKKFDAIDFFEHLTVFEENMPGQLPLTDFEFLFQIPALLSLDISDLVSFGGEYQLLRNLVKLTHLAISDQFFRRKEPLYPQSLLPSLQSLSVPRISRQICTFDWHLLYSLTKIEMNIASYGTEFITSLVQLANLKILNFTSEGSLVGCEFESFAGMTNLQTLIFGMNREYLVPVWNEARPMPLFSNPFSALIQLKLINTAISSDRLRRFETLPGLRILDLLDCNVELGALDRLRERMPGVTIYPLKSKQPSKEVDQARAKVRSVWIHLLILPLLLIVSLAIFTSRRQRRKPPK